MESGPVFADLSGRRRRVLRFAGLAVTAVLAICLGAVVVAMTGGPQAPFTQWAVQQPQQAVRTGNASQQAAGHGSDAGRSGGSQSPGALPGEGPSHSQGATPSAGASPSASSSPSATATGITTSGTPVPTNRAGKTPPGHTKSPNPHKSSAA